MAKRNSKRKPATQSGKPFDAKKEVMSLRERVALFQREIRTTSVCLKTVSGRFDRIQDVLENEQAYAACDARRLSPAPKDDEEEGINSVDGVDAINPKSK